MRFLHQLGSTWFHFSYKNLPQSRLRAVLGRLGGVLKASWGVLGGLGASWGRLGASWRRLGASWVRLGASWGGKQRLEASWKLSAIWGGPGSQLRLAAGNQEISRRRKTYYRKTTYRKTTEDLCRDRVPLDPDTQLGAFGPGADRVRRLEAPGSLLGSAL